MGGKWLNIKARNEKEARKIAKKEYENFLKEEVKERDLIIRRIKPSFMDKVKGVKPFRVALRDVQADDIAVNVNGYCRFRFTESDVQLKIIPPQGKGKPVTLADVKSEAAKKELEDVDWEAVENLLGEIRDTGKEEETEWLSVAPRRPDLDRDAEVEITLSEDGMEAYLSYTPPLGGKHITKEQLEEKVEQAGVIFGLKEDELNRIPGSKISFNNLLIAEGRHPAPGKDGYLEYHYSRGEKGKRGKILEDGTIDHYQLDLVENVEKGQPLVTVKPPVPGQPGQKVTGEEVAPEPPQEAKLPSGKNVVASEDGTQLFAEIDGQVSEEGGKINVYPVYQVHGDVDVSTGHIDFVGNVIVDGNVSEGLKIEASGDVEVSGSVTAGTIISGGNILIRKGYRGKHKSKIEARGNITVKFIENGEVITRGDLEVGEAILHSNVSAGGSVAVKGKGLIAGGRIQAGREVEANTFGSSLATKTEILVGIDPRTREEHEEKVKNYKELSDNLDKVQKAIRLLESQKEKGVINEARLAQLKQLQGTEGHLREEVERLREEVEGTQELIKQAQGGSIKVHQHIFPGVTVQIAHAQHTIKDKRSRTMVVCSEGEIAYRSM